ncbi:hypothetical protein PVNG_05503 [Plasmodium vivax North Korean]|uniref:Variable surface protein Vir7-like protein n=1 Tax=Plasmodium vivax North Korean TaxID=1035514 RepID=A0A0J9U2A1_PLAVI|nr:hypothetical protein PVNG_05503 [Plasmodium vivax North Korean]
MMKEDLKGLPSNFHYYYFDNEHRDCHSLEFHSNIKGEFQGYYNLNRVFDKIIKALCFIYNRKKDAEEKFERELCSYLYYWLGDKIYANISDTKVFTKIIKTIYQEINSTDLPWICNPIYEEIDQKTFNNNKLLFDYSKDRENIRLSTVNALTTCDEHYKKAIEKYRDAYIDAYSNCNGTGKRKYDCDGFRELFEKEPRIELSSFYCKDYKAHTSSTRGNEDRGQNGHSLSGIESQNMISLSALHPATDRNLPPQYRTSAYLTPGSETIHEQDGGHIHPVIETAEGGSSKTIAGSIVPVLGVSSFSLLLYKVI